MKAIHNEGSVRFNGRVVSVYGNFFGTDLTGLTNATNGAAASGKGALTVANVNAHIGDGTDDRSNVFAYNNEAGIHATLGDHLISNNSFYCNREGGIDHNSGGQMGNPLVTTPQITNANNTLLGGTAQGMGMVEVYFHDDTRCPNVPCQGEILLGTAMVDPATGMWAVAGPFTPALNIGDFVTATFSNADQTSEFSECVQVCPDLVITVGNEGPYCEGDSVQLTSNVNSSSQGISYTWTGPNNFMSMDGNPTGVLDSGLYELVMVVDGCEYAPLTTRVVFLAADTTSFDTTICENDFIVIGGERFDASRPTGQVVIDQTVGCDEVINVNLDFSNEVVEVIDTSICRGSSIVINGVVYNENNLSGSDTIIGGTQAGCDSVIQVSLTIRDAGIYNLDTVLCPKGSITINGIVYDQFYMAGTDTIKGGSFYGCDSVLNVRIRYPEPIFDLDTIPPNCDGSQEGQIIINGITGILSPFQYSLNGSPFTDITQFPWTINALDEGQYDIIFEDGKNCRHLVQLSLGSTGQLDFTTNSPVDIAIGDSIALTYSTDFTPDSSVWKDVNGNVVCIDCPELIVRPGQNTTFTVTLYKDGCSETRTIVVNVDDNTTFYVPNIFSPDGNGINDYFNVFSGVPGIVVEQLTIYDRWGEIIYLGRGLDASANNQGWDGTYNSEALMSGVYVYHFQLLLPGNRRENLKGAVTIIR